MYNKENFEDFIGKRALFYLDPEKDEMAIALGASTASVSGYIVNAKEDSLTISRYDPKSKTKKIIVTSRTLPKIGRFWNNKHEMDILYDDILDYEIL